MDNEKLIELVRNALEYEQECYMCHYGTVEILKEALELLEERNRNEKVSR